MKPHRLLVLLALGAACGGAGREATDSTAANDPATIWVVRPDSFGRVPLGVPIAQAAAALGDSIALGPAFQGCALVRPPFLPLKTALMLLQESASAPVQVERVDVDTVGILTAEGIGVGDTEARIREAYGERVSVDPHKYLRDGHYLVVAGKPDTLFRIVFETDGERVVRYRAGRRPAVDFVERCG